MITVADALPGDETAIAALCAELDEFYGGFPAGEPTERAQQARDILFGTPPLAYPLIARDEDTPAGLAVYSFLWPAAVLTSVNDNSVADLKELYVAQAYRRSGVGRILMDALRDTARRRGLSRVEWTTDTSNQGAQAFYEALTQGRLPQRSSTGSLERTSPSLQAEPVGERDRVCRPTASTSGSPALPGPRSRPAGPSWATVPRWRARMRSPSSRLGQCAPLRLAVNRAPRPPSARPV